MTERIISLTKIKITGKYKRFSLHLYKLYRNTEVFSLYHLDFFFAEKKRNNIHVLIIHTLIYS